MQRAAHYTLFLIGSACLAGCLTAALWWRQYEWALLPLVLVLVYLSWSSWEWLLVLLLVSLPWSTEYFISGSLATDFPDEAMMLLLTLVVAGRMLLRPDRELAQQFGHPLIWVFLLSLVWMATTVFLSSWFLVSLKILLTKFWYTGAFLVAPLLFFRSKRNIRLAGLGLALSMVVCTMIILWQHTRLGLSFATINQAVQPFFRNHVNYSSMLVCILPILAAVWALDKRRRWLLSVVILVMLAALFLTFARGAWLALLTGGTAVWWIRRKLLATGFLAFVIICVLGLFWLRSGDRYLDFAPDYRTTIFHPDFREHLLATYEMKDISTAERFNRWVAAAGMVEAKPLTGFGPAAFYFSYKPYQSPAFRTWVSDNPERSTVHNYFLLVLTEQGIPGLLLFLVLATLLLAYTERLYHRLADRFYRITVLTTGSMLVMILTLNMLSDLMETDKVGSLFLLCMAMLVSVDVRHRANRSDSGPDIQGIP